MNRSLYTSDWRYDPVIGPLFAPAPASSPGPTPRHLRLLSFNIQTGIASSRYRHYFTHSWKHVLPCAERLETLDRVAALASEFDIVGLQEADAGSLRSGFINQTEYVADRAAFPHWYDQTNRKLGHLAQHSLGVLSRFRPSEITEVRLPGMIPGRGALCVRFGQGEESLLLVIVHLALGARARVRQFEALADLIQAYPRVVLMGDLNCRTESKEVQWLLRRTDLSEPAPGLYTFPSWRPRRNIDHILVSSPIRVDSVRVLNHTISDHLPIAMDITLPLAATASEAASDDIEPLAAAGF